MHLYTELVDRAAALNLDALRGVQEKALKELQTSAATVHIKVLQTIQLQRAVMAVGMFSIFEAMLRDALNCDDGFDGARNTLKAVGADDVRLRFSRYHRAINVLKHGRGRSYDELLEDFDNLPFRMKRPDEFFLNEGDVSKVSTLIEVDDKFVQGCADIIREVSEMIHKADPSVVL